ncbi:MAG: alpha/beta fold hydrolase [Pseudolabrys sp.]
MAKSLPLVLVPGLLCSARLYAPQLTALWPFGQVAVADHRRQDHIAALADHILREAPPRFALAGLSFGGYLAFEMMRQAPERIGKLALLDTSPRPDTPEQTAARYAFISMTEEGRFADVVETLTPRFVHANRRSDGALMGTVHAMAADTGPEAFVRQEKAIISRPDSRPLLGRIRCPTLVLVGDGDELTTPEIAREIADGVVGANLVVVPNCGHLSTIERPEPVNAALAEWLEV